MNRSHGKPIEGEACLSVRFAKDSMFVLSHFVPLPKNRNKESAKRADSCVQSARASPAPPAPFETRESAAGAALPPPAGQAVGASGRLDEDGLRDIGELLDSVGSAAPFFDGSAMGFQF